MRTICLDVETSKAPNHFPWLEDSFLVSVGIVDFSGLKKVWYFNHKELNIDSDTINKNLKEIQYEIDNCTKIVGHNIVFDLMWLRHIGVNFDAAKVFCTMVAEYILSKQKDCFISLNEVCKKYSITTKIDKVKMYWDNGYDTDDIPIKILSEYLLQDCISTLAVFSKQVKLITEYDMGKLMDINMEMSRIISDIQYTGMKFDIEVAKAYAEEYSKNLEDLDKALIDIIGYPINLNSGDQLSAALYGGVFKEKAREEFEFTYKSGKRKGTTVIKERPIEKEVELPGLGFTVNKKLETKKGGIYKTDKDTLNSLTAKTPEQKEIIKVLNARSNIAKALDTYFIGLQNNYACDKCIHGTFNQTVTATGRLSSSRPKQTNWAYYKKSLEFRETPFI